MDRAEGGDISVREAAISKGARLNVKQPLNCMRTNLEVRAPTKKGIVVNSAFQFRQQSHLGVAVKGNAR
jgi:hypothetical protein